MVIRLFAFREGAKVVPCVVVRLLRSAGADGGFALHGQTFRILFVN